MYFQPIAFAWEVELHNNPYLPDNVIAVSKDDQNLIIIDNKDKFDITNAFPSIHGEIEGDKYVEGDLKTPEGVYFVTTKIKSTLDFEKYGSGAYVLNYPNPIDIIRKKTGHGIWIHSKGNPILGQVTQGCVAVDLDDFSFLGDYLPRGTAVVMARQIKRPAEWESAFLDVPKQYNAQKQILAQKAQEKEELQAQENTESLAAELQANTEEFIALRPKARTLSYFTIQTAKAIAGTLPPELKEEANNAQEMLVAYNTHSNNSNTILSDAALAQSTKDIEKQSEHENALYQDADFQERTHRYEEPENPHTRPSEEVVEIEIVQDDSIEASWFVEQTKEWNKAWESRSDSFFDFYDPTKYGLAQSQSYQEFKKQKQNLFSWLPWIQIIHGEIFAAEGNGYWVTWFDQLYRAPNTLAEGTRRLYWQQDLEGNYKIVAMEWIPAKVNLEDNYLEEIKPIITALIEDWRMAWLNADIEKYRTFYLDNAVQDHRKGEEIFAQKSEIWQIKKPQTIDFSNTEIISEGNKIRIIMNQKYADSTGYSDFGVKELYFTLENDVWKISLETWKRKR